MSTRRGISLVELLTVLSGCSIVLGLTAGLLHQTMRSQSETRHYFDAERNAMRLSRQFRLDVHAAQEAATRRADDSDESDESDAKESAILQLIFADGRTVDYESAAGEIIRIESQSGKPTARETFRLGETLDCRLEELNEPSRWKLELTGAPLTREPGSPGAAPPRSIPLYLSVEAALGRDSRFAGSVEQEAPQ